MTGAPNFGGLQTLAKINNRVALALGGQQSIGVCNPPG
jgi:hypothetical protein